MIDNARTKKQILSLLNANERDTLGARLYSVNSGDEGFIGAEIDTAIEYAKMLVKEALASDNSLHRGAFIVDTPVAHGTALPSHYGTHGIPKITPYLNAPASMVRTGTRKSVEEITSYRENSIILNSRKLYSDIDHDQPGYGDAPSSLAGFYSVVEDVLYFTGYSAVVPLAVITGASDAFIPAEKESVVQAIALGKLAKDGTVSEKFGEWMQMGNMELSLIRTGESAAPSIKPTVGSRDSGTK